MFAVPIKMLPCRVRLLVPPAEEVLPCLGTHLINFCWVGHQCPDFFIHFLVVSHLPHDTHLGSAFILIHAQSSDDPACHDSYSSGPSARSSVCELSAGLLPLDSCFSGSRVHISLGIVSFPSVSLCSTCSQGFTPKSSHSILFHTSLMDQFLPLPDLHIDFAHKSWRRLLAHKFSHKPRFPSIGEHLPRLTKSTVLLQLVLVPCLSLPFVQLLTVPNQFRPPSNLCSGTTCSSDTSNLRTSLSTAVLANIQSDLDLSFPSLYVVSGISLREMLCNIKQQVLRLRRHELQSVCAHCGAPHSSCLSYRRLPRT